MMEISTFYARPFEQRHTHIHVKASEAEAALGYPCRARPALIEEVPISAGVQAAGI